MPAAVMAKQPAISHARMSKPFSSSNLDKRYAESYSNPDKSSAESLHQQAAAVLPAPSIGRKRPAQSYAQLQRENDLQPGLTHEQPHVPASQQKIQPPCS